jgi:hypothetical protein
VDDWTDQDFQLVRDKFIAVSIDINSIHGAQQKFLQTCYPAGTVGTANCMLIATAAGKHLARMKPQVGLREWNKLPEQERKPGAVQVEALSGKDAQVNRLYQRSPGMLIATVYTRPVERNKERDWVIGTRGSATADPRTMLGLDHLWLTEAEWKSLLPATPRVGDKLPVPRPIVDRMVRYHITLEIQGCTLGHSAEDIRSCKMILTVEEVSAAGVRLRLDGSVLLASPAGKGVEVGKNKGYGFNGKYLGYLNYNTNKQAFDRFDIVAVGESWTDGKCFHGCRPGRHWTGIAFELPREDVKAPLLPPACLSRNENSYFGEGK